MSTRITEVSIADTQWVRVAEFDEEWPLSITVKYEKTDPLPAAELVSAVQSAGTG
jgi:hypothetical protein